MCYSERTLFSPYIAAYLPSIIERLTDKGTGLFQYFIKLVPTVHSLELEAEFGSQTTSQFAYTYKFRSITGATEYHTDHTADVPHHHAAHGEEHGKGGSEPAAKTMLLPGVCQDYGANTSIY